jgi:hypothetical protein
VLTDDPLFSTPMFSVAKLFTGDQDSSRRSDLVTELVARVVLPYRHHFEVFLMVPAKARITM